MTVDQGDLWVLFREGNNAWIVFPKLGTGGPDVCNVMTWITEVKVTDSRCEHDNVSGGLIVFENQFTCHVMNAGLGMCLLEVQDCEHLLGASVNVEPPGSAESQLVVLLQAGGDVCLVEGIDHYYTFTVGRVRNGFFIFCCLEDVLGDFYPFGGRSSIAECVVFGNRILNEASCYLDADVYHLLLLHCNRGLIVVGTIVANDNTGNGVRVAGTWTFDVTFCGGIGVGVEFSDQEFWAGGSRCR